LTCLWTQHQTSIHGCQIFFIAYGQNLNKKWPNWLFFEKVKVKITKSFNYDNLHNHKGLKMFKKAVYFLPIKSGFAKEASFAPKLVVLKVVDIDPQGTINSHGVEWGSLNSLKF